MKWANSRQVKKGELRTQQRHLKQRYKMASEQEKPGLLQLMEDIRKQIRVLGRKERIRQKRREWRKKREAFLRNPYGYVRDLFQSCSSGASMAPQAELEEHLRKTYNNPRRSVDLPDLGGFDRPPEPGVTFDLLDFRWQKIQEVVRKARSKSALV